MEELKRAKWVTKYPQKIFHWAPNTEALMELMELMERIKISGLFTPAAGSHTRVDFVVKEPRWLSGQRIFPA